MWTDEILTLCEFNFRYRSLECMSISYWASFYCVFQTFIYKLKFVETLSSVICQCHFSHSPYSLPVTLPSCKNLRNISNSFMVIVYYCNLLSEIFDVIIIFVGETDRNLSINNRKVTDNSCMCSSCSIVGGGKVRVSFSFLINNNFEFRVTTSSSTYLSIWVEESFRFLSLRTRKSQAERRCVKNQAGPIAGILFQIKKLWLYSKRSWRKLIMPLQ